VSSPAKPAEIPSVAMPSTAAVTIESLVIGEPLKVSY
jgi:hypothetical protein